MSRKKEVYHVKSTSARKLECIERAIEGARMLATISDDVAEAARRAACEVIREILDEVTGVLP